MQTWAAEQFQNYTTETIVQQPGGEIQTWERKYLHVYVSLKFQFQAAVDI